MASDWRVHKFGGSSVADSDGYRRVAQILDSHRGGRSAVVVSAMSGVTDALMELVQLARARDDSRVAGVEALRRRQVTVIRELLPGAAGDELAASCEADFENVQDLLRAIWLMRADPEIALHIVSGHGELWSAQLLARFLASRGRSADWLDAREVLEVEHGLLAPTVRWKQTRERLGSRLEHAAEELIVVPGFVAVDADGLHTTLGRNGSDYTASIFGALLEASEISIWTDVDGVLSADPRRVAEAVVLGELSYHEAMELAYFGAKVIHPATMAPAVERGIPIYIRNTFNPVAPGTKIHAGSEQPGPVKGLATIDGMALFNVEGTGMIGVPGISERLFGALRNAGVSVVLISQGSSEHSICFAVPSDQTQHALVALKEAFFAELHQGQIQTLDFRDGCTVLAVVGDKMAGVPGVAAKFFGALGRAGVNVRAIAQGSSERNISAVIDSTDATRALRSVHAGFYLSNQTLSIGLIGPGIVGGTLLDQFDGQAERLNREFQIDLRVRGIARSSRMLLDDRRIAPASWCGRFDGEAVPLALGRFVDHVQTDELPHTVLIDCTANADVAGHYESWLRRGIHVITPNKIGNTGSFESYRRLRAAERSGAAHFLYEATVGAGLPIIQTLRDLIRTGDEILRIEGVLSGTLSYLFNSFDGQRPFSEILREAREKGYTEPDPREDLSGMDVARKVVILAREMGLSLELDDVAVESLVPDDLASCSVDEFLERIATEDADRLALLDETRAAGEVLRFVGLVAPGGRSAVRLARFPETHPFARIQLTDNIVQFTTARYRENPLVVQGPGAGPEVTAGGVFADLLRLAEYVGH